MGCALIVVDMVKDNLKGQHRVAQGARDLVPKINRLITTLRSKGTKIVFACDSFLPEDFIFQSRLTPHCIRGTEGCQVAEGLNLQRGDIIVEKRRFSAFFKTDLDQTLRTLQVNTVAVCGITLPYCVLTTAMDALSHDFSVVILEDCTLSFRDEEHKALTNLYRKGPLYPLLRVMSAEEFLEELEGEDKGKRPNEQK